MERFSNAITLRHAHRATKSLLARTTSAAPRSQAGYTFHNYGALTDERRNCNGLLWGFAVREPQLVPSSLLAAGHFGDGGQMCLPA